MSPKRAASYSLDGCGGVERGWGGGNAGYLENAALHLVLRQLNDSRLLTVVDAGAVPAGFLGFSDQPLQSVQKGGAAIRLSPTLPRRC